MSRPFAFVTLVTSDHYLPGALVVSHSLREVEGPTPTNLYDTVCVVTPATVSVETIRALRRVFDLVVGVEEIRTRSWEELALLGRPDLSSTITKIHIFRLIQYTKLIYLDADVLILRPLSQLFSLPQRFSAAPDTGWPDCFNSGVMVFEPDLGTFDGLMGLNDGKGSWDGGDQGLLNEFFGGGWNRLSFTFNTTPSGLYEYAPAARRHGSKISVVHFIGPNKPWHRLNRSRSSTTTTTTSSSSSSSHDYNSLVNRWFEVYERHYGQISTLAVSYTIGRQGPPGAQAPGFKVPTYSSVWDEPGGGTGKEKPFRPVDPEELRRLFAGRGGALKVGELSSVGVGAGGIGRYTSLPLEGRPDLVRMVTPPQPAPAPAAPPPPPSQPQPRLEHPQPQHPPSHHHGDDDDRRPPSPPKVTWDPARSSPPKNSREYQMREPIEAHYENIWDSEDRRTSREFFSVPSYGGVPRSVEGNYSNVMMKSTVPDRSAVRPVFPWEERGGMEGGLGRPTRVFPKDEPPTPLPPIREGPNYHQQQLGDEQTILRPDSRQPAFPPVPVPGPRGGLPPSLNYVNAWDSISAIKKYAEGLVSGPRGTRSGGGGGNGAGSDGSGSGHGSGGGEGGGGGGGGGGNGGGRKGKESKWELRKKQSYEREGEADDEDEDDDGQEEDDGEEVDPEQALRRTASASNTSHHSPSFHHRRVGSGSVGVVGGGGGGGGGMIARPVIMRAEGSLGSSSRLPTLKSVVLDVPSPVTRPIVSLDPESALSVTDVKAALRQSRSPSSSSTSTSTSTSPIIHTQGPSASPLASPRIRASQIGGSLKVTASPVTKKVKLPSPLVSPRHVSGGSGSGSGSASSGNQSGEGSTNNDFQNAAAYRPARVFDPKTDTGIVRKEGLDALQRFVQSMEAQQVRNGGGGGGGDGAGTAGGSSANGAIV